MDGELLVAITASVGPERKFPAHPDSLSDVREFVDSALRNSAVDPHDVAILTTEVATNAIRHAKTDFRVHIQIGERAVRVEVINDAPEMLLIKKDPSEDGGRGIHLPDGLTRDWGVETRQRDKVVWFELDRRKGERRR